MQQGAPLTFRRDVLAIGTILALLVLGLILVGLTITPRSSLAAQPSASGERTAPTNLVTNGDFESGTTTGWANQGGGTITVTTSLVHGGNFAAAVTTNATINSSSGAAGGGNCSGGLRIPVSASTSYTWGGWINVPVGTNLASARIRVAWYVACSGGSQLSTGDTNLVTSATGTWVQVTGTATSPATAAFAELRLFGAPSTANSITLYFDDVTMDANGAATPTNTATSGPTNTPGGPTTTPTLSATPLPPAPRIHDIESASHISTYSNTLVSNVQGIVTALRTNGFFMQDPLPDANDATSEGIFVFTSSAPPVAVGDLVAVNGRVTEFRPGGSASTNLTTTEIGTPTVSVLSSGNPLPTPVVIGSGGRVPPTVVIEDDAGGDVETGGVFDPNQDGIDFYESLESMRVQVNNPVATGLSNSFGEISVLADDGAGAGVRTTRGGIIIQPTDFNPERIILDGELGFTTPVVNVGDHFSGPAVGIMDYSFGNFKLQITQALTAVSGGLTQEVATPAGPNQIAIGNFNVENLAPSDPPAKFATLAGLIVNNVKSPDIISVEEVQDNSGATDNGVVDADLTWNALIAAIQAAGGPTYQYRQINPVNNQDGGQPGGNIRQGFLFRTDRGVSFVDRAGGCSTCAVTVLPGPILSSSPGRVDPNNAAFSSSRKPLAGEFLVNGQRVFVIGNHFNSKGGDDPLFGHRQPPILSSEVQRNQQAQVVNDFVDQILAVDANANIVVLGDLNDFYFSSAVMTLKGNPSVLNDLVLSLPLPERYTYVFDGNSQDLDHILVSNYISATVPYTFDVVHVNSDFANQASDHEPQVVRLAFPAQGTPTATGTPPVIPTRTATPGCTSGWNIVPSPNRQGNNKLNGIAAVTTNDVWAVGYASDGPGGVFQTLVEHWNGVLWSVVPSPNVSTTANQLNAITVVNANDIWAVGTYGGAGGDQTLILHWSGTAWSIVPSPNVGSMNNYLFSVDAVAANDVWAVGHYYSPQAPAPFNALSLHWDGTAWSVVPSPPAGAGNSYLTGVVAFAANDVWAVGHYQSSGPEQTLTLHWTGSQWNVVPSPNVGTGGSLLYGVGAVGPNDIWAVGIRFSGSVLQTLTLHWDGTTWTAVSSPNGPNNNVLYAVSGVASNDVWAVGSYNGGPASPQPEILHWDGSTWSIALSPSLGGVFSELYAVVAVAPADVWAVGSYSNPLQQTLVERYVASCLTPTVTPSGTTTATRTATVAVTGTTSPTNTRTSTVTPGLTPTSGTSTPTRTPTVLATVTGPPQPTNTVTVTPQPTACALTFQDVPVGSTFYPYIRCLACRGIVGGYPCGGPGEPCPGTYYRPNNNVTRGQTSKIVSESAGFSDPVPSTQQTFEDVAPGSTFALWIERLSVRGIIQGYPCGGPFEPCVGPTNRPYFRPNNNVTRGQLSKITSGAAGWTETPTTQTFQDVPPGSTFYVYIERMAARGIIQGYPCGGPFEPCIGPTNRPYFRPNNNATRGQMAKIAASAFFPNCQTPARR